MIIIQNVTPCSQIGRYQCFGGTCCLHLCNYSRRGTKVASLKTKKETDEA
jgi:hypothetical protein